MFIYFKLKLAKRKLAQLKEDNELLELRIVQLKKLISNMNGMYKQQFSYEIAKQIACHLKYEMDKK